jgi:hypothetical protein
MFNDISEGKSYVEGEVMLKCRKCKALYSNTIFRRSGVWFLELEKHILEQNGKVIHHCGGEILAYGFPKRRLILEVLPEFGTPKRWITFESSQK